jgi:hypothetical protein
MADSLHFNLRLEGNTTFSTASAAGCGSDEIEVATVVLLEAGLSGWKDEPYRASIITEFRGGDATDRHEERKFPTQEELCTWLEQYIADLRAKRFETVRYKVNGLPIDWLNRINLPPD